MPDHIVTPLGHTLKTKERRADVTDRRAHYEAQAELAGTLAELSNELDAYRRVFHFAFSIVLNANDFYGYACADACQIDDSGFPALLRLAGEFGGDGIYAAMATARNCEPLDPYRTTAYKLAFASITDDERKQLTEEECSDWAELTAKLKLTERAQAELARARERIAELEHLYGTACVRLQQLGEKEISFDPIPLPEQARAQRSVVQAGMGEDVGDITLWQAFLNWNRDQPEPPVLIGSEYAVAQVVCRLRAARAVPDGDFGLTDEVRQHINAAGANVDAATNGQVAACSGTVAVNTKSSGSLPAAPPDGWTSELEPARWICEGCGKEFDRETFSHSRAEDDGKGNPIEVECGPISKVNQQGMGDGWTADPPDAGSLPPAEKT